MFRAYSVISFDAVIKLLLMKSHLITANLFSILRSPRRTYISISTSFFVLFNRYFNATINNYFAVGNSTSIGSATKQTPFTDKIGKTNSKNILSILIMSPIFRTKQLLSLRLEQVNNII